MKYWMMLCAVGALAVCGSAAFAQMHVGIVGTFPWSVSLQATFPDGFALEAGVAASGPAVFAAKLYFKPLDLWGIWWVPHVGVGGAIAFLPGDLVAWGVYGLAGLEWPIPRTQLSVLADIGILLPLPIGTGTLGVAPVVGLRLDF